MTSVNRSQSTGNSQQHYMRHNEINTLGPSIILKDNPSPTMITYKTQTTRSDPLTTSLHNQTNPTAQRPRKQTSQRSQWEQWSHSLLSTSIFNHNRLEALTIMITPPLPLPIHDHTNTHDQLATTSSTITRPWPIQSAITSTLQSTITITHHKPHIITRRQEQAPKSYNHTSLHSSHNE